MVAVTTWVKNGIPGSDIVQIRGFFLRRSWDETVIECNLGNIVGTVAFTGRHCLCGDKKNDDKTFTMETVEVTAEKLSEYVKNHPQNVETVERKEIIRKSLLSVEEVLKTMPGVEIYPSSGVGSRISIRGSGKSGGVLVLLNGRPLNTNQYGGVDLNTIPVEMIESVAVFKPPVPVWLGPGAADGAINIVTRNLSAAGSGGKEKKTTVMAAAGSFGSTKGSASHIVPIAGGSMMITGSATHTDGKRDRGGLGSSDREQGFISGKLLRVPVHAAACFCERVLK